MTRRDLQNHSAIREEEAFYCRLHFIFVADSIGRRELKARRRKARPEQRTHDQRWSIFFISKVSNDHFVGCVPITFYIARTMAPVQVLYHDASRRDPDSNDPSMEKDVTERELEKVIFGDDVGFHENLKHFGDGIVEYDEEYSDQAGQNSTRATDEEDFESLEDSQVR